MSRKIVLVTGANGEIGRALITHLTAHGAYDVVALDLTPLPDAAASRVIASYTGNIMDRHLLDQIVAHHEFDVVFHLAALLSARGERDPQLSHQVNVEGTLNVLRVAQDHGGCLDRSVQVIFPSSIAVYGLPSLEEKRAAGRVREEQWNAPTTMYGCNKLYCEHLGRYFTRHAAPRSPHARRLDFRAVRFPGILSADTVPTGGTSDFGPEIIHGAAAGRAVTCFVEAEARIPFLAMPDAVLALVSLSRAAKERLSTCVYNVGAFNPSAGEIAERTRQAFPGAQIEMRPDAIRSKVVSTWPEDVCDVRARDDWGWRPEFDWERAMMDYLVPGITKRNSS